VNKSRGSKLVGMIGQTTVRTSDGNHAEGLSMHEDYCN
jgi:hypothetical protein